MSVPPALSPPHAFPASTTSRAPRWLTAVILTVAALAFLPTLAGGFLGDDFVYIARFRELPWSAWPPLFIHDWSGGIWGNQLRELRPFAALSFMTDAKLFGGWAPGYQLTNLALHLAATALVTLLAWRYTAGHVGAVLTAGLVFALHPAHAEAIIWATGRVDLLATAAGLLFWLGAAKFSDHGRPRAAAIALGAFFLGIFSKELCMFAPLLLLLHWVLLDLRVPRAAWLRRAKLFAGVLIIFALYATARRLAFGQDHLGYNLWTETGPWHRQGSLFSWLFPILPFIGRAEWATPLPVSTLHALWLAFAALTALGLTVALLRRTPGARLAAGAFFFGGVWYFVTVFPLTAVIYFSPRHLYFPTVGFALAAGLIVAALRDSRARIIFATALIAWCGLALLPAIRPWRNAATVSRQALAALNRELVSTPTALVVTSVPDTLGTAWLWAWSSPALYAVPFIPARTTAAPVIERPVNYTHTPTWVADRKPIETLRAAPEAIALFVTDDGQISCRRVSRDQLQSAATTLAAAGLSNESWQACVKSLALP